MSLFINNLGFVTIPSSFIENIMPRANGEFVRVYLYMMNAAQKGIECDFSQIASELDLLESDVVKAITFLSENGVLTLDGDNVIFGKATDDAPIPKNSEEIAAPKKRYDKNVKEIITENSVLSDLCQVAQQLLEKTLSDRDIETLYWFYDGLGLSPEVIVMIIEHCVSDGKRNMNYIEKVAISWHENSITTITAAEEYMQEKKERSSYFYTLRQLFGIDNRNLSKTEEVYLKTWRDSYLMSEEMVALAYEYCIMSTGKLSFPYMNTIIENWFKKNILTVPDAEKDHEEFKNQASGTQNVYVDKTGFDYNDVEKIMQEKYDE